MMVVVFYDRKNQREVRSDELMPITLVQNVVRAEAGQNWKKNMWIDELPLGTIGYRSAKCPSYQNWDLYLTESDLVFLRLEANL